MTSLHSIQPTAMQFICHFNSLYTIMCDGIDITCVFFCVDSEFLPLCSSIVSLNDLINAAILDDCDVIL